MERSRHVLGLMLASLLAAPALHAQPLTTARHDTPAIGAPRTIVSADFNGDGWPDIALGGTTHASVGILLNRGADGGDGEQFGPRQEIVVGGGPFDLAAGDLNRDGRIDLAIANADSNAITVLFNNGHDPFSAASKVDLPVAQNPRGLALADINRDGILDIVVTKYMGTTFEVLFGAGNGTFPTRRSLAAPGSAQGIAVADFNQDGWPDVVIASATGTVSIYLMHASGASRSDIVPSSDPWNLVSIGDFDHNGRADFVLASTTSSFVQIVLQTGAPLNWAFGPPFSVGASPRGLEVADLNQDGNADIITAGRTAGTVTVLLRGAGPASTLGSWTITDHAAGAGARDVAVADVNHDGRIDLLTANEYGNSTTLLQNVTAFGTAARLFDRMDLPPLYDNATYDVGDFNGNGKADLVRRGRVLLDGTTLSRPLASPPGGSLPEDGAAGDFNRDGKLDVLYTEGFSLQMFFGDGAGQFTDGPRTETDNFIRQIAIGDLNRDGLLDVVVGLTNFATIASIEIRLGHGDGTFTRSSHVDGPWTWLAIADLNRDGIIDVASATEQQGITVMLGNGQGGVASTRQFGAGTPRYGFALGDVTDDGIPDLVVADGAVMPWGPSAGSRLTVARGIGDGSFETMHEYDTADPGGELHVIYGLTLGDLDLDGHLDIFTGSGDLLRGAGDGRFGAVERFAVFGTRVLLRDVNGDGLSDALGFEVFNGAGADQVTMLNTRRTQDRPPTGLLTHGTVQWRYGTSFEGEEETDISAGNVADPDLHAIRYRWTLTDGTVVEASQHWIPRLDPGTYRVTVTADDYRGESIHDTFTLIVTNFKETVLRTGFEAVAHGDWQVVADSTAADGVRLWSPNRGAAKLEAPLPNPTNYFELGFLADPTQSYKLWIRMKADGNNWANDSVFVQFTGAQNSTGHSLYEIGSSSALAVNLEECSGCGVSGWGWEDDGWGAVNRNGVLLHFPAGGPQTIRVQTREDGVSIDQIVLSATSYRTARPGKAKNDATLLPHQGPYLSPR